MKVIGTVLMVAGTVATAWANPVPEIDAGSTVSALALISGSLLILKSRWKK